MIFKVSLRFSNVDYVLPVTFKRNGARALWSSDIKTDEEGHAVLGIVSGTTNDDLKASLRIAKPPGAFFKLNSSSEWINGTKIKDGDFGLPTDAMKQRFTDDFDKDNSHVYGSGVKSSSGEFTYGYWAFDGLRLLFLPNSANLAAMPSGTEVISVLGLNMLKWQDHTILATSWFRVTLRKTGVSLRWVNGESGSIVDNEENSYAMISGLANVFFPPNGNYSTVITARDSGMIDGDQNVRSTSSSEQGFNSEVSTKYGKWLWKTDNSGFRFDPNAIAINQLVSGDNETSTLHVQFANQSGETSHEATISVSITGASDSFPSVSITSDAGNADGTQGTGITVGHEFEYTLERTGPADSALPVSVTVTRLDQNRQPVSQLSPESFEVSIPMGESSWKFSRGTDSRNTSEMSGIRFYKLEITEKTPSTYDVGIDGVLIFESKDNRSSAVSASNPRVSITAGSTAPYRVGATAIFTVTASDGTSNISPTTALTVNYKIGSSEFLGNGVSLTGTVSPTGAEGADISIPVADPDGSTDDPNGTITVTLLDGEGYVLADSPNHKASVDVTDDAAVLSVAESSTVEGNTGDTVELNFTVSLSAVLKGNVSFNWSTSDGTATGGAVGTVPGTDYHRGSTASSRIDAGESSITISVNIFPDENSEPDETFTVTLSSQSSNSQDDGNVTLGTASAAMTIIDDDAPELSIENAEAVEEGSGIMAMFPVTIALQTQPVSLTVNYTPTNVLGDFLGDRHNKPQTHTLTHSDFTPANNLYRAMLPVAVDNDGTPEKNGSFQVTLTAPATAGDYSVSTSSGSATVNVTDDDGGVPTVNLRSENLTPGAATLNFQVTSDRSSESELSVAMTVTYNGGDTTTASAAVPTGQTVSEAVAIPVRRNGNDLQMVSIDEADHYNRGANASLTPVSASTSSPQVRIEVLNSLATIAETKASATDSAKITFRVTAQPAPSSNLDVSVHVTQTGDFVDAAIHPLTSDRYEASVSIGASTGASASVDLEISLADDLLDEDNGSVTATIQEHGSYELVDMHKTRTVAVTDDDVPVLSLQNTPVVNEGNSATVTVASDIQPWQAIPVSFTVANSTGTFLDAVNSDASPATLSFAGSAAPYTATITVATQADPNYDAGAVTVSLVENTANPGNYQVGTPDSETIAVNEQISSHVVSIRAIKPSVQSGEDIEIVLECNPPPESSIDVVLRVTQNSDILVWPVRRNVRFSRIDSTVSLTLPTLHNPESTNGGMVSVAVIGGDGYTGGSPVTVEVSKSDPGAVEPVKYSVVSSVITEILTNIPPTPPQGESRGVNPTLSIRATTETVTEGQPAVFTIFASHAISSRIPVKIKLSQSGDFIVGPMDRTVNLNTGLSETEFAVATDNDELAEPDGMITAIFQVDRGYFVGSQNTAHVIVSDAVDRQQRKTSVSTALHTVLPELLAHSTARTLEIANNRITQGLSGSPSTSIELNGKSPAMTALQSGGEMLNNSNTDWQSLIDDSSFTLELYPEGGETSTATIWGVGDKWSLSSGGNGGQKSWDGEIHAGHFGFDAQIGQGMLAGLAMSVSQSEIDFGQIHGSEMSFGTMTAAVHPFLGYVSSDENSRLQIMAGYGENELELKQEEYLPEILTGSFHTVGLGGSKRLYSNRNFGGLHNLELNIAGEAWHSRKFVNQSEAVVDNLQVEVGHVRIAIEGTHDYFLSDGGTVSPTIAIGLRGDGKNNRTESGFDVGSEIEYQAFGGLEVAGSGKILSQGLNRLHRWEIEGTIDYDSGNDGRGVLFRLAPSWSGTDANVKRYIWGSELAGASNVSIGSQKGRVMNAEIGYGFDALDGSVVITPFHAFRQTKYDGSEFQVGSRFVTDKGADFELGAFRNVSESGTAEHELNLTGKISW